MIFCTKFSIASGNNDGKVYDTHDLVDRLTYVSQSQQVLRFLQAGYNSQIARARALTGLWSTDDALGDSTPAGAPSMPYLSDVVERQQTLSSLRGQLDALRARYDDQRLSTSGQSSVNVDSAGNAGTTDGASSAQVST